MGASAVPYLGVVVTLLLAGIPAIAGVGALYWRMKAAEARLKVLEVQDRKHTDALALAIAQLSGLDATLRALSVSVSQLAERLP